MKCKQKMLLSTAGLVELKGGTVNLIDKKT